MRRNGPPSSPLPIKGSTAAKKSDIGNAAAAVYSLPSSDFHDITSG